MMELIFLRVSFPGSSVEVDYWYLEDECVMGEDGFKDGIGILNYDIPSASSAAFRISIVFDYLFGSCFGSYTISSLLEHFPAPIHAFRISASSKIGRTQHLITSWAPRRREKQLGNKFHIQYKIHDEEASGSTMRSRRTRWTTRTVQRPAPALHLS